MSDRDEEQVPGLEGLYADREPPADLEERVTALYERASPSRPDPASGGVATSAQGRESWGYRAVAGLVLFLAGFGSAWLVAEATPEALPEGTDAIALTPPESTTEARRFMLLLWERPDFAPGVAPSRLAAEYAEWARGVAGDGIPITGHELGAERTIAGDGAAEPQASVPGRQAEVPARLGGFFIVEVADEATARRLAEGHPHLGYGGWIEVAEVL